VHYQYDNTAFGERQTVPDAASPVCRLSALQQALTSLGSLFQGLGAVVAGITGSYLGHRGTIVTGCLLVIVGDVGTLGT
jgi:hypothetical protein